MRDTWRFMECAHLCIQDKYVKSVDTVAAQVGPRCTWSWWRQQCVELTWKPVRCKIGVCPVGMGMSGMVLWGQNVRHDYAVVGMRPQRAVVACPGAQEQGEGYGWSCGPEHICTWPWIKLW